MWPALLVIGLILLVLAAIPTFRSPAEPAVFDVSVASNTPTGDPKATVSSGVATIKHDQQFCFALGAPVSQGGDFHFAGGIYGGAPRLKPSFRIKPMGSRELGSIGEVPELPPMTGLKGFAMQFYSHNGYDNYAKLVVGQSYAIVCADKTNYAMIRVLAFERNGGRYPEHTFEWMYQANGSPVFADPRLAEVSK